MQGIIEAISEKDVSTKFGQKKVWSLKMDDGKWYGGIWKQPQFAKGDTVEFNTKSQGAYGDKVDGMVNVISSGGGAPPAVTAPASSSGASPAARPAKKYKCTCNLFPIHPLDSQMSIITQSSLNRANEVVLAFYNNLAVAEQKKTDIDQLWSMINALADKYVAKACGQDIVEELLKEREDKFKEFKKLTDDEAAEEADAANGGTPA